MSTYAHGCLAINNSNWRYGRVSTFPRCHGHCRDEGFMSLALRLEDEWSCSLTPWETTSLKGHPHRGARRIAQQAGLYSTAGARDSSSGLESGVKVKKPRAKKLGKKRRKTRRMLKQRQYNPITRKSVGRKCQADICETENQISSHNSEKFNDIYQDSKRNFVCDQDMKANVTKQTNRLVRKELQKAKAMVTKETDTIRRYFGRLGQLDAKNLTNLAGVQDDKDSPERNPTTHLSSDGRLDLTRTTNLSVCGLDETPGTRPSTLMAAFSRNGNNDTIVRPKSCPDSSRNEARYTHFQSSFDSSKIDGIFKHKLGEKLDKATYDGNNNAVQREVKLCAPKESAEAPSSLLPNYGVYSGQRCHQSLMCRDGKSGMSNAGAVGRLASSSYLSRQGVGDGLSSYTVTRDVPATYGVGGSRGDQTGPSSGSHGRGKGPGQDSVSSRCGDTVPMSSVVFLETVFAVCDQLLAKVHGRGQGKPAWENSVVK